MTRVVFLLIVVLISVFPGLMHAESTMKVKLTIDPKKDIMVKQAFTMNFEILTNRWFSGEPIITFPSHSGLVVVDKPISKTPISQTVQGQTLSGILIEFVAYPIAAGELTLGPIKIDAKVTSQNGAPNSELWQSEVITINAVAPAGVENMDLVIVADRLEVSEQWQPEDESVEVGNALTRNIVIRATGTQSMLLPEIGFPGLKGVSQYPSKAELTDSSNRGIATATRKQSISYVLESKGSVVLPALQWTWFSPSTQQIETVLLPEKKLKVKSSSQFASGGSNLARQRNSYVIMWVIPLLVFMLLTAVFLYKKYRLNDYIQRKLATHKQSPKYQYKELLKKVEKEPAASVLGDLYGWLDLLPQSAVNEMKESEAWVELQLAAVNSTQLKRRALKEQISQLYLKVQRDQVHEGCLLRPLYPN